jgi:signal transduction histidine kinase
MPSRRPAGRPERAGAREHGTAEALRRLDDLSRLVSDWLWETDAGFRLTYTSPRVFETLRFVPAEVLGKTLAEIGRFVSKNGGTSDLNLRQPFRDAPFEAVGRDGEKRIFLVSGLPLFHPRTGAFQGVSGTAKDITERRRAEIGFERLAAAVESLPQSVALFDAEDRLVFCNRKFRDLNAASRGATVPGTPFERHLRAIVAKGLCPEAVGREEEWLAERLARHRSPGKPFELARQNGLWLLVNEHTLPDGGTITFSMDITELKAAQVALKKSEEKYRNFAADVAHELRTPLAVLRSHLDNLEDDAAAASLRPDVDSMGRLVEQLLAQTRLDFLTIGADETADLSAVCVKVAAYLGPIAIKENRSLQVKGAKAPVRVRGNGDVLEQAVRNLVDNAIRYSARNSIITLEVTDEPGIRVIDHGRGIRPEDRARVFDRFQRADRRMGGAGLGLAIVRRSAEAHGAKIDVADTPGGGATISLRFPSESLRPPPAG